MFDDLPSNVLGETSADEAEADSKLFELCSDCKGTGFVNQGGRIRHCPNGCQRRSVVPASNANPEPRIRPGNIDLSDALTIRFSELRRLMKILRNWYGDEVDEADFEEELLIKHLSDGESGPGLYVWVSEVADEGCEFLGDDTDTPMRIPATMAPLPSPDFVRPEFWPPVATCIYCGCTDDRACLIGGDEKKPCSWLRLDRATQAGVCSACPGAVKLWDSGQRTHIEQKEAPVE